MSVALKWVGRCATPRHATPCPVLACPGLATPLRWDVPGSMQSHEDVLSVAQRLQTAAVAELDPQPVAVALVVAFGYTQSPRADRETVRQLPGSLGSWNTGNRKLEPRRA